VGDGEWLDGRAAHYVTGKTSPMGFNVAVVDGTADGNDFTTQRAAMKALGSKH
jgi:hypothetical protein